MDHRLLVEVGAVVGEGGEGLEVHMVWHVIDFFFFGFYIKVVWLIMYWTSLVQI